MGGSFAIVFGTALIGACVVVLGVHFFLKVFKPEAFLPENVQPHPTVHRREYRFTHGIEIALSDSIAEYWSEVIKAEAQPQKEKVSIVSILTPTLQVGQQTQTSTQQCGQGPLSSQPDGGPLLQFPGLISERRTGAANAAFSRSVS